MFKGMNSSTVQYCLKLLFLEKLNLLILLVWRDIRIINKAILRVVYIIALFDYSAKTYMVLNRFQE